MKKQLLLLLFLCIPTFFNAQTVRYVSPAGNGNGTSWSLAFGSLASALQQSQSGDEIWVAQGTYRPTTGTDATASFVFKNGVKIYGGFLGTETSLSSRADNSGTTTILSGALSGTARSQVILKVSGASSTLNLLDGFTIQGANWTMANPALGGSGIQILNSTLELRNVIVRDNTLLVPNAGQISTENLVGGAGIYGYQSNLKLDNVTIKDNILNFNATSYVNGAIGGGAGIYLSKGTLDFKKGTIDRNVLTYENMVCTGGGAYLHNLTDVQLERVMVSNNKVFGEQNGKGGGIYTMQSTNVKLVNNIFHGNYASGGGAAVAFYFTSAVTTNNTFGRNNRENIDPSPVAVYCYLSNLRFDNCAFLERMEYTTSGNTIVYNNSISRYALGQGTQNGVVTAIMDFIDPLTANYTPKSCSPYINTGTNTNITAAIDFNGNPRIVGAAVDYGAIELQHQWTNKVYVDVASTNNFKDGSSWGSAFTDLNDALKCGCTINGTSVHPAEVWVAQGTYRHKLDPESPYAIFSPYQSFKMKNNQKIYGGFQNGATSLTDRDVTFATRQTILSGLVAPGYNVQNVVLATNTNATAQLDGFIVQEGVGATSGSINDTSGSGMFIDDGTVTLKNVWIRNNHSPQYGGGILLLDSGMEAENLKVTNNSSLQMGGGIYYFRGTGNTTQKISNIKGFELVDNSSGFGAGGMSAERNNTIAIEDFSIRGNTCNYYGGAFYISRSFVTLKRGTFDNNQATGIVAINTFGTAGAIFVEGINPGDSNMKLENVIFSNNKAGYGGALTEQNTPVQCVNSTFVNNIGTIDGNLFSGYNGSFSMKNVIIDTPENGFSAVHTFPASANNNPNFTIQQSLVTTGFSPVFTNLGNVQLNTDPLFIDKPNGNYNITACGPAVDAGLNSYLDPTTTLDAGDNTRIKNNIVDLGALEYQYIDISVTQQPQDQSVNAGSNAVFSIQAGPAGVAMQWQVSTNNGATWTNIAGATNATLTLTATNAMNNNKYRCVVSDCVNSQNSAVGILHVNALSIPEEDYAAGIVLYPNPGKDHFTIKTPNEAQDGEIAVFDIQGRMLLNKKATASDLQSGLTIKTEDWAHGTYLVQWRGKENRTIKFVKTL